MTPAQDPPRLPGLDLLRAVAIVGVMLSHANGFGLLPSDCSGWMGVDLFFALSGFLIGGQVFRPLAQGRQPRYRTFFARRLLRTLPAYLVVVAVYAACPALRDRASLQPLWQFLSFTQNLFIDPAQPNAFSQAWSLCVEEQFYLLLPLAVVILGPRARPRLVLAAVLALVAAGMGLRGWLWLAHVARTPFSPSATPGAVAYMKYIYYPTWTRLDPLLAGVGLALVRAFRPSAWAVVRARPNAILAVGALGVLLCVLMFGGLIGGLWAAVFGYPLLAVSMAALVVAGTEPGSLIGRRAYASATALAAASYSLYLVHKLAYRAAINLMLHAPPLLQPLTPLFAILAALALGAALHLLVERPFLKLRDRFRRPPAPVTGGLAPAAE